MATIGAPEEINHDRRRFVETVAMGVAAIGTAGLPKQAAAAMSVGTTKPFSVGFPEEQVVDLRGRIAATRWPDKEQVTDETQGVRLATMRNLVQYWQPATTGGKSRRS
jgi:hypothetical protein